MRGEQFGGVDARIHTRFENKWEIIFRSLWRLNEGEATSYLALSRLFLRLEVERGGRYKQFIENVISVCRFLMLAYVLFLGGLSPIF